MSNSRLFRSALLVCIGVLIGQYNSTTQINCNDNTDNMINTNKSEEQQIETISEEEAPILLDIPKTTKEIVINVGTSIDPILPGKTAFALLVLSYEFLSSI